MTAIRRGAKRARNTGTRKPRACKCSMRGGEHEVTCPAFDVDAAIDSNLRAPDRAPTLDRFTNGRSATQTAEPDDDDDGDEDADEDEGEDDAQATYGSVVDGKEAVIDTRLALPLEPPSHDTLMNALLDARRELDRKTLVLKAAKDAHKMAQMSVDAIVAQLAQTWEERHQIELPLANPCASCGERAGTIPLANGAFWCVSCSQTAIAEPQADTPQDARSPALDVVIRALADAVDSDSPEMSQAIDIRTLLTDEREPAAVRQDVTNIAKAYGFRISVDAPYVHKLDAVPV